MDRETLSTLGFSTLGGDGDDVLDGGEGSNRLEGGAGNDVLKVASNSSDNVFSGGTGDDMLYGSAHSDTYLFNQGTATTPSLNQEGASIGSSLAKGLLPTMCG